MTGLPATTEDFAHQVVVVTGAAHGIGAVIAAAFALQGSSVVLGDLDGDGASATARALPMVSDARAVPLRVDLAIPGDCRRLISMAADELGGIDVLVNCAGVFARTPAVDMAEGEWRQMFAVNVDGAFHCSVAAARRWIADGRGGAIVNMSSSAATHSSPGVAAYSSSKAALSSLTRSLAVEWAGHGIRINAVAPGHVNVERIRQGGAEGRLNLDEFRRAIPMGRLAEPEEVADAVLFLAGPRSSFITGQVLSVDGGFNVPPIYRYEPGS